jgi:hypothetical protein
MFVGLLFSLNVSINFMHCWQIVLISILSALVPKAKEEAKKFGITSFKD